MVQFGIELLAEIELPPSAIEVATLRKLFPMPARKFSCFDFIGLLRVHQVKRIA
jgi:hypothetical protein